eukprot:c17864_g1_i4.p1 GENE.c17864_g1_i4~~c17864_g1_i4.p1  ORF type:complete len:139 (-),score=13.70 c17864_g1_i4:8-424(-)
MECLFAEVSQFSHAVSPSKTIACVTILRLRQLILLIDSRHGLLETDRVFLDMIHSSGVPFQIVLTKCDKISGMLLEERIGATRHTLGQDFNSADVIVSATSVTKRQGIEDLRGLMIRHCGLSNMKIPNRSSSRDPILK